MTILGGGIGCFNSSVDFSYDGSEDDLFCELFVERDVPRLR